MQGQEPEGVQGGYHPDWGCCGQGAWIGIKAVRGLLDQPRTQTVTVAVDALERMLMAPMRAQGQPWHVPAWLNVERDAQQSHIHNEP